MEVGPIRFAWIAFALVALGALAGGLYVLVANTVFWVRAETAEATVVGFREMEQTDRSRIEADTDVTPAEATVASFRDPEGVEHVVVSSWGSSFRLYEEGEHVTVLYDPAEPDEAMIRSFVSLYALPLLLLVFGVGFSFAAMSARVFAS